jgi:hypothetical protein
METAPWAWSRQERGRVLETLQDPPIYFLQGLRQQESSLRLLPGGVQLATGLHHSPSSLLPFCPSPILWPKRSPTYIVRMQTAKSL